MKTLLITGAAGRIGSFLRPELAGRYRLRLSDIRPVGKLAPGETFMRADARKFPDMLRATRGVDAVLHFGGMSGEHDWATIRDHNIDGFYNALEAARRNGVKRFLVATSNHAVGFYRCDQKIDHRVYPRPDSRYGVAKVFNEALASLYADKYGMQMFCMRIGNVNHAPIDRRRLAIWISGRDMAQLCTIGIEHPDIRFEIVYGVSDNARSWYDNANAYRLGYRPQDASEPYAEAIIARDGPPTGKPDETYQGGIFVVAEGGTKSWLAPGPGGDSAATGTAKAPAAGRPRKPARAPARRAPVKRVIKTRSAVKRADTKGGATKRSATAGTSVRSRAAKGATRP